MNISYVDEETRNICYSIINISGPFILEEIEMIRAHIADLRAAPSLADAPIDYSIIKSSTSSDLLKIEFDHIRIICRLITAIPKPKPNQIKRIQILEIIKTNLQIPRKKLNNL